jgi:alpha-pyrone synthase
MYIKIMEQLHQAVNTFSLLGDKKSIASKPFVKTVDLSLTQLLPTIEGIATGTPNCLVSQADAAQFLTKIPGLEQNRHRIKKLYKGTRIDNRHLAIQLLSNETIAFSQQSATIEKRMQMYEEYAIPLAEKVVSKAIQNSVNPCSSLAVCKNDIRLIIFVSSTGFIAPGIDTQMIERLELRRDIARVSVNFMGCAAAMNGLRIACDHVRANPTHKALVVCLELSSVNAVFEDNINDIIIHSIFGDGCAAVVLGASTRELAIAENKVVIKDNFSYLVEDTQDGIRLGIRDNGITCKLSRELPNYIEAGVNPIIQSFLNSHQLTKDEIDLWAVHPGGTRIIEKAQSSIGLSNEQVADSWEILREYGNMLSVAVLFVLERMLLRMEKKEEKIASKKVVTGLAFSFSPGVGVEGLLFKKF